MGMYLVLQADLQAGIFYCITGFVLSFQLLKRLKQNGGVFWTHPARIYLERYMRLVPLYFFMLLFLTEFMRLLGGSGPMFYQFMDQHSCRETWIFHVLMINNVFPWGEGDLCMGQSWYLANDIWFMATCLFQVANYSKNPKRFWVASAIQAGVALAVQVAQICVNDYRASYLSFQDQYWTEYYDKPYTFFHCYNIGMILGVQYFIFKYETEPEPSSDEEPSQITNFFRNLKS
mmetsp:Transcript_4385/g.7422  ORF Transcript_4385/g.7422 Transcript_4385/m.7422 type:complete len:232 (-) Transcript_4385:677-1372(-)